MESYPSSHREFLDAYVDTKQRVFVRIIDGNMREIWALFVVRDGASVEEIVERLRKEGVPVWFEAKVQRAGAYGFPTVAGL